MWKTLTSAFVVALRTVFAANHIWNGVRTNDTKTHWLESKRQGKIESVKWVRERSWCINWNVSDLFGWRNVWMDIHWMDNHSNEPQVSFSHSKHAMFHLYVETNCERNCWRKKLRMKLLAIIVIGTGWKRVYAGLCNCSQRWTVTADQFQWPSVHGDHHNLTVERMRWRIEKA